MTLLTQVLIQAQTNPATQTQSSSSSGAIFGWLIGGSLALLIMYMVARPLLAPETRRLRGREATFDPALVRLEGLREDVNAERQALQDLEFDRELDIIEERDYTELKERSSHKLEELNEKISLLQPRPAYQTSAAKPKPLTNGSNTNGKSKPGESEKVHLKPAIKEKLKCSECGTPFKPGSRFCAKCSAPLPVVCLNCGKEVTEDDRFCSKCGAAVNT